MPMDVTLLGMVSVPLMPEPLKKASSPMLVTALPKSTLAKPLHPLKASLPILVAASLMTKLVIPVT